MRHHRRIMLDHGCHADDHPPRRLGTDRVRGGPARKPRLQSSGPTPRSRSACLESAVRLRRIPRASAAPVLSGRAAFRGHSCSRGRIPRSASAANRETAAVGPSQRAHRTRESRCRRACSQRCRGSRDGRMRRRLRANLHSRCGKRARRGAKRHHRSSCSPAGLDVPIHNLTRMPSHGETARPPSVR